jgi:hypothetical protein
MTLSPWVLVMPQNDYAFVHQEPILSNEGYTLQPKRAAYIEEKSEVDGHMRHISIPTHVHTRICVSIYIYIYIYIRPYAHIDASLHSYICICTSWPAFKHTCISHLPNSRQKNDVCYLFILLIQNPWLFFFETLWCPRFLDAAPSLFLQTKNLGAYQAIF